MLQKRYKRFFVTFKKSSKAFQLVGDNDLDRIGAEIVPCLARTALVFLVVGTGEEMNIGIDRVRVVPQLLSAIGADKQVGKDVLLAVLRLRFASLRLG